MDIQYVCLFVCLQFFIPLENFSLIRRRHHCQWGVANFDLCSALMAIEQWRFLNVPHLLRPGLPYIMIISEDPWHSQLLPSVWQWNCHYLFLRHRSVTTGDRTLISRMRGERIIRESFLLCFKVGGRSSLSHCHIVGKRDWIRCR